MTRKEFWNLIDLANQQSSDSEGQVDTLRERLKKLPEEEIIEFGRIYNEHRHLAYRRELWGATYLINGGCSDDGFEYFRGWLISRGRQVFERAVADPDSLAYELPEGTSGDYELESMLHVAAEAYQEKTGAPMPEREQVFPDLTGHEWKEDELETLFPKLAARLEEGK